MSILSTESNLWIDFIKHLTSYSSPISIICSIFTIILHTYHGSILYSLFLNHSILTNYPELLNFFNRLRSLFLYYHLQGYFKFKS